VARIGNIKNVYKGLVRRPQRKRKLVRPRHRWDNNIKMDLKEVEREYGLIWLRIRTEGGLYAVMNFRVP
jgi:hypothetical protein